LIIVNAKSISILISSIIIPTIVFSSPSISIFAQAPNPAMNNSNYTVHDVTSTLASLLTTPLPKNPPSTKNVTVYAFNSSSMTPALHPGDYLIVENHTPFTNLKVGDIILFKSPFPIPDTGQHESIVARVAGIYKTVSDEQIIIRTKGDANPESIPGIDYPITEKNYIGRVLFVIPK
jgi:signal peptidase I